MVDQPGYRKSRQPHVLLIASAMCSYWHNGTVKRGEYFSSSVVQLDSYGVFRLNTCKKVDAWHLLHNNLEVMCGFGLFEKLAKGHLGK